MHISLYCGPYMKNWRLFFFLVIHISALFWGLTGLKFSFTWVWCKGPQDPPKYEKKYIFHILGLNLKMSHQIASPATPGFYIMAQHDPKQKEIYFIFFIFFILTQKVLIIWLLYLTCKLLLKRVDVNQDGSSLIINPPTGPPNSHRC